MKGPAGSKEDSVKGAMGSFRVPSTRRSDRFWPRRGAKTALPLRKRTGHALRILSFGAEEGIRTLERF